jgi:hypothetical protein
MKRWHAEGAERFALFVGALMIVAALLTKSSSCRKSRVR